MYNEHFGLQQAPFRITPDTRLFYEGGGRGEILDALVYAIVSGEGIVKVVGEVGAGKTMLCRMLEERLPEHVEIVYLANPSLKPDDILQAIALEMNLNIAPGSNRLKVMHAMQQHLLEKHATNRQIVVFVEEAQSMPIETLEEIRLLSNLETKREKLLQIVLFGQPELDENLNQPNIRQLKERITHSFYLEPLKRNELKDYVNFRMRAVGYRGPDVFRTNAYVSMTKASEGLTRRINILADKALLAAYANDRHEVTLKDVRKAINDSQFELRHRLRLLEFALVLGALVVAGAAGWSFLEPLEYVSWPVKQLRAPATIQQGTALAASEVSPTLTAVDSAPAEPEPPKRMSAQDDMSNEVVQTGESSPPAEPALKPETQALAAAAEPTLKPESQALAAASEPDPPVAAAVTPGVELIAAAARAAMLSPDESLNFAGEKTESIPQQQLASAVRADAASVRMDYAPAARDLVTGAAASHPSDLIATRLAVTRHWLAQADNDHYSIQLLLTAQSQRQHVEAFLSQRNREGAIEHVYVYETIIDDRPYFGVLYREFSGYSAAKRALENLPVNLKRLGPFIRNLRDVSSVS